MSRPVIAPDSKKKLNCPSLLITDFEVSAKLHIFVLEKTDTLTKRN
jgi:hypothetical protein